MYSYAAQRCHKGRAASGDTFDTVFSNSARASKDIRVKGEQGLKAIPLGGLTAIVVEANEKI